MFSLARICSRFARHWAETGKGPDPIFALWHRAPKRSWARAQRTSICREADRRESEVFPLEWEPRRDGINPHTQKGGTVMIERRISARYRWKVKGRLAVLDYAAVHGVKPRPVQPSIF